MEHTPRHDYYHDGTRRARSPMDTLAQLLPRLQELGITRLCNITGLDRIGVPVVTAVRPASRSLAVSQGKGVRLIEAKVSALMESIEMRHAERPDLSLRLASRREMAQTGQAILDVDRMPMVGGVQIDPDQALLWAAGEDLISGAATWVPYAFIAIDDTLNGLAGPTAISSNSNGLASGNTKAEAIVHALCEVIERDASTLWRLGVASRRCGTAVDLETVDDANCRALLARFARAEIDVLIFEITTDVGVPAYEALIRERTTDPSREQFSAVGSGCHLWRGVALTRALTEAAQCRLTHIAGVREDLEWTDYAMGEARRAEVERYLTAAAAGNRSFRSAANTDPYPNECFEQNIPVLLRALVRVGITQVVAVDLTSAQFAIPVVKVFVPGLEGVAFEHGFVPGARAIAAGTDDEAAL